MAIYLLWSTLHILYLHICVRPTWVAGRMGNGKKLGVSRGYLNLILMHHMCCMHKLLLLMLGRVGMTDLRMLRRIILRAYAKPYQVVMMVQLKYLPRVEG